MLKLNNLEKCFEAAKESNAKYIIIIISNNGNNRIVTIEQDEFEDKLTYYKNVFNENLISKIISGTKIIYCTYTNIIEDMEIDLIG